MKSLKTLSLRSCDRLQRFPQFSEEMGRLLVLRLDGCDRTRALPSSIRHLSGLTFLTLATYLPVSTGIDFVHLIAEELEQELEQGHSKRILPNNLRIPSSRRLTSLRILDLTHNYLVEDDFPSNLRDAWPSLEELNLSENIFTRLPASISHLSHLKYLDLGYCINLEELHELPSLIQVLKADRCKSLKKIGDLTNKYKWLFQISLHCCPKLLKDRDSQSHLANMLMKSLVQKCAAVNHRLSIAVPGTNIPNWFSNQQLGTTISLNLPQNRITKMIGLAVCCLCSPPWLELGGLLKIKIIPTGKKKLIDRPRRGAKSGDRVWIGYMSIDFLRSLYHDFEYEDIVISFESSVHSVLECGACVVYQDDVDPMTSIGSYIPDYEELESFNNANASSEDSHHGRWSSPTFSVNHEEADNHKTVEVVF